MIGQPCWICECTDEHACAGGCWWIDADETVCSACFESFFLRRIATESANAKVAVCLDQLLADFQITKNPVNIGSVRRIATDLAFAAGIRIIWQLEAKETKSAHRGST